MSVVKLLLNLAAKLKWLSPMLPQGYDGSPKIPDASQRQTRRHEGAWYPEPTACSLTVKQDSCGWKQISECRQKAETKLLIPEHSFWCVFCLYHDVNDDPLDSGEGKQRSRNTLTAKMQQFLDSKLHLRPPENVKPLPALLDTHHYLCGCGGPSTHHARVPPVCTVSQTGVFSLILVDSRCSSTHIRARTACTWFDDWRGRTSIRSYNQGNLWLRLAGRPPIMV